MGASMPGHKKGYVAYDACQFYQKGKYYFTFADPRLERRDFGFTAIDYQTRAILAVERDGCLVEAFADRDGNTVYTLDSSPFENETKADELNRFRPFVKREIFERHLTSRVLPKWWVE